MRVFTGLLLLAVATAAGCDSGEVLPSGDNRDCRDDGVGCTDGFSCQESGSGVYECLPVHSDVETDGVITDDQGIPDAAPVPDQTPGACDDGLKNGIETDVDCGGDCDPCADTQACNAAPDCQSGVCTNSVCRPTSCGDGLQNGAELAQDCGGGDCPGCPTGTACNAGSDCESDVCGEGVCQAPRCDDGTENGTEADVDCGGECNPCTDGSTCLLSADCQSGVCRDGTCQAPRCGDTVTNGNEQCDDGNQIDTDDCTNGCTVARCGDGVIKDGVEACDDGNDNDNDGCLNDCTPAQCGDGIVHEGVEACDDGNDDETDSCLTGCFNARCGDGLIQAGVEVCDDGNTTTEDCEYGQADCTVCAADCTEQAGAIHVCGDGITDPQEACDDGNTTTEDCEYGQADCTVCAADCTEQAGAVHVCGDGITDPQEACDDGNTTTEDCEYGQMACTVCAADCTEQAGAIHICGDDVLDPQETCDDGNAETETCEYGVPACDVCNAVCNLVAGQTLFIGDGLVDVANGEECDDGLGESGEPEDGDGCSAMATVEQGFECDGEPSVCTRVITSSCGRLNLLRPDWTDGIYVIDPDDDGPTQPFAVYCDMTTDGGGWTQVITAHTADVGEDPPDFNYNSAVWREGYGVAGDRTHISPVWYATPIFSEVRWVEDDNAFSGNLDIPGNLSEYSGSNGLLHFNINQNCGLGPCGGRLFREWKNLRCNTGNSSTNWGVGFGAIRTCQRQYGTLYYEMSYTTLEFWIR